MPECKRCGGGQIVKSGKVREKQRYLCKQCGYHFVEGDERENNNALLLKALCTLFRILGSKNYKVLGEYLERDPSQIYRWMSKTPNNFNRLRNHTMSEARNFRELFEDLHSSEVINGKPMLLVDNAIDDLYVAVIIQRREKR